MASLDKSVFSTSSGNLVLIIKAHGPINAIDEFKFMTHFLVEFDAAILNLIQVTSIDRKGLEILTDAAERTFEQTGRPLRICNVPRKQKNLFDEREEWIICSEEQEELEKLLDEFEPSKIGKRV